MLTTNTREKYLKLEQNQRLTGIRRFSTKPWDQAPPEIRRDPRRSALYKADALWVEVERNLNFLSELRARAGTHAPEVSRITGVVMCDLDDFGYWLGRCRKLATRGAPWLPPKLQGLDTLPAPVVGASEVFGPVPWRTAWVEVRALLVGRIEHEVQHAQPGDQQAKT